MNEKLDVFEILGKENINQQKKDQGQESASDPDFNDAINVLRSHNDERYTNASSKSRSAAKQKMRKKIFGKKTSLLNLPFGVRSKRMIKVMILVVITVMLFTFVIHIHKVAGSSMKPALEDGDVLIVNLLADNYEAGDIVVFKTDSGEKLVKRIVGVSGDMIDIKDTGELYLNGNKAVEEYVHTKTDITDVTVHYPIIVSDDSYFVMGDNRIGSKDSRNSEIGLITKDDIIGKVVYSLRKM